MSKPEYQLIGESFLQQFFSNNSSDHISKFYGNDSVLSVENDKYAGTKDITDKLSTISAQYQVSFNEIQPSQNGLLIFLSGKMLLQGESNAINFHRIFFLAPTENGSIYIKNDMFLITFG